MTSKNFKHTAMSEAMKKALSCEWNSSDGTGPASISIRSARPSATPAETSSSPQELLHQLIQWYLHIAFEMNTVGYSYHSYQMLAIATESMKSHKGAARAVNLGAHLPTDVLAETQLQFYHFCFLLYDGVIASDVLFVDWLTSSVERKLNMVVAQHRLCGTRPFAELLMNCMVP